jgi:hypothetical protein
MKQIFSNGFFFGTSGCFFITSSLHRLCGRNQRRRGIRPPPPWRVVFNEKMSFEKQVNTPFGEVGSDDQGLMICIALF